MWDNTQARRQGVFVNDLKKENVMGGHSSGPSSYEIQEQQRKAEEAEKKRIADEKAKATAEANAHASGGETHGGEGSGDYDGALSAAKRKKGATLAGEGAQTFGSNGNLGA
jgi:hypothetical protein